ncbi:MAG: MBL fold metallo-hydrolase [Polyangiaceae bacterium]|nr:MBL fold metallo-hydrolase [Polyangiaceae bacterium]
MRYLAPLALLLVAACAGPTASRPPKEPGPVALPKTPPEDGTGGGKAKRDRHFAVHVVDVGTGLGVFVEGPDFTLVYDAGSNDDLETGAGNRFVAYLKAARPDLKRIDHVILSHPHRDHVELLPDVVDQFAVREVWDSGGLNPICGYRRFVEAVSKSEARYHTAGAAGTREVDFGKKVCNLGPTVRVRFDAAIAEGTPVPLGAGASMTFLHVDGKSYGSDDANRNSLVMLLALDDAKVLFMGDAEAGSRADPTAAESPKSAEGQVLAQYKKKLRADVLIAGHHGSKSSSRKVFVDAVRPKFSVISSGPMQYGKVTLPDAEVVEELQAAGKVLRTDVDDEACARAEKKIGPAKDGRPGGCSNIRIDIDDGKVRADYVQ